MLSPLLTNKSKIVQTDARSTAVKLLISQTCDRKGGRVAQRLKRSSCLCCDLESEHHRFHEARGMLDIDIRPYFICRLRVPQTLHQSPVLRAAAPGAQCYQVGVGVPEFADRANTHAAPLAHGFIGSNDADNKRFNSGQRRSRRPQPPDVLRDALSLVSLKRFQIKPVFVAERVVHALPADIHRTQQIVRRSCSITLSPENGHRPFYGPITIKFPRSCPRCELVNLD